MKIRVQRQADRATLDALGVETWPVWEKAVSRFPWTYDETETCYVLQGRVTVTAADGEAVSVEAGDLVVFPAGLSCTWDVQAPIRKHYRFG